MQFPQKPLLNRLQHLVEGQFFCLLNPLHDYFYSFHQPNNWQSPVLLYSMYVLNQSSSQPLIMFSGHSWNRTNVSPPILSTAYQTEGIYAQAFSFPVVSFDTAHLASTTYNHI